jgi:lipoate-protein ligase A
VTRPLAVWLDPRPHPGWRNMAVDEALLVRAGGGERWLRLYRWRPTLSFGRHEPAERRFDARLIERLGLATVRRPTGGRAVWHADELTYTVALPAAELGGLRPAYRAIHRVLQDAVRHLGAPAELAAARDRTSEVGAGACFATPVGGEVMVAGRKLVGSAQLRRSGALLQHGSLLLDGDQTMVGRVTSGRVPADGSIALSRALGRVVSWDEAAAAVMAAAERAWPPLSPATAELLDEVERDAALREAMYCSPSWTWQGGTVSDRPARAPLPPDAAGVPC